MSSNPVQSLDSLESHLNNPERASHPFDHNAQTFAKRKSKIRSIYQNFNFYEESLKGNAQKSSEIQAHASSCFSSKAKYDLLGDALDYSNYTLAKDESKNTKIFKRRQKMCKSAQNKRLSISLEQQEKLFSRITIHCLKSRREAVQSIGKELESEYSFTLKKIAKLKKSKFFSDLKDKKMNEIKFQSKKLSQQLHKSHLEAQSKKKQFHEQMKRKISEHRSCKKEKVLKKIQQNSNSASQQRLLEKSFHSKIEESTWQQFLHKKSICQKEKKEEEKRRAAISRKIQARKEQAKKKFRNRWQTELEMAYSAKQDLQEKKDKLKTKMAEAIQSYNKLLLKRTPE